MTRLTTRAAIAGATLTLALFGTTTAAHADPVPSPTSSSSSSSEEFLTQDQLAAQIAQAGKLQKALLASNKKVAAQTTALNKVSAQANAALDTYSKAKTAERTARAQAAQMRAKSAALKAQLERDRQALRSWAVEAYTNGGDLAKAMSMIDMLGEDASQAGNPAGDLEYMTDTKIRLVERIRQSSVEQEKAAAGAVAQEKLAVANAAKATAAKKKADAVVAKQRTAVAALRKTIASQVSAGTKLTGALKCSGDAEALAAATALAKAMSASTPKVDAAALGGKACSNDNKDYPNGQVPAAGLCPLYKAPGDSLRPKAALAFNAMSKAYEKDFGHPICVTDSYRSYAEQVAVKASRGFWAARPGTSNHGLGLALDLCGGVNSFGSAQHAWMKQNGPTFGFFHPGWAEPGGALPEPWHWEFAG